MLGAGIAGMMAALELRNAGYRVQVLEYNGRAGGRTGRCAAAITTPELGGARQQCGFDAGLYINPGPWRFPIITAAMLNYCKRLGVALEPFIQINANAYLHSRKAFGGKPQRLRAHQGRLSRARRRAAREGHAQQRRSMTAVTRGGPRDAARSAAVLGRARQGLHDTSRAGERSERRGYAKRSGRRA